MQNTTGESRRLFVAHTGPPCRPSSQHPACSKLSSLQASRMQGLWWQGQLEQRHATPRHATPRHATPRHATPRAGQGQGQGQGLGLGLGLGLSFVAAMACPHLRGSSSARAQARASLAQWQHVSTVLGVSRKSGQNSGGRATIPHPLNEPVSSPGKASAVRSTACQPLVQPPTVDAPRFSGQTADAAAPHVDRGAHPRLRMHRQEKSPSSEEDRLLHRQR